MAVIESTPYTLLIGIMLSTSLLDLSTLFGGGRGGIWVEEGFKLHAHLLFEKRSLKLALHFTAHTKYTPHPVTEMNCPIQQTCSHTQGYGMP